MQRADPKVFSVQDLETSLEEFKSEAAETDPLAETLVLPTSLLATPAPIVPASDGLAPILPTPDAPASLLLAPAAPAPTPLTTAATTPILRTTAAPPLVAPTAPAAIALTVSPPPVPAARARAQSPIIVPREAAVSLAEVLTAQVRIESYEAVAIVQALCALVLESRMPIGRPTADLSRIRISADGTVSTVSAGKHNQSAAVQYLGDVLSKTLPNKDFMFLRERVVEKTTSSPPHYSSVEELSDTLAYYERPDRVAQIRAVYSRWETRPPLPAPSEPMYQRLLGLTVANAVAFCRQHARAGALGLIGLAVVLVVGLLGLLARGPGSNQAPSQTPASAAVSNPQRTPAVDSRVGRIAPPAPVLEPEPSRRHPGSAPTVPPKAELSASVADSRISPPARGAERAASRQPELAPTVPTKPRELPTRVAASRTPPPAPRVERAPSRQPELVGTVPVPKKPRELPARIDENRSSSAAPIEPEGHRPNSTVTPPSISDSPLPLPKLPPDKRVQDAFVEGTAQSVIYSVRNADVIPPAMLFSQLPGPSPLASPQHDVPALEIVVNERGTVDVVRYVVRPRNIAESVVITNGLSAAKAWRFRPALKDGHPVPYRLLVALSND